MRKNILKAALAATVMLASAGAAFAAPATASSNVNVRSGPGGGYGVVDVLRRGDRVDVQQCRGGWCYIEKRGPDGWVSANYLNGRGNGGTVARPGVSIEFNFGNTTPQRPQPPRPPRPDHGNWNGGHHGGGWNGGNGGWDRDRDRDNWDRDDRPRRPRDWDGYGR